jgi:hypothetical protein
VRVLVHRELAGADGRLLVGLHRAAEDRLQSRDDLVEREGLRDVVVAAGVQPSILSSVSSFAVRNRIGAVYPRRAGAW